MKCIVKDCENHTHEGKFVGDLCSPCHAFITTGEGGQSQAYRNLAQKPWVGLTVEERNYCIKFPGRRFFERDGTTSERIALAIEIKLREKNT